MKTLFTLYIFGVVGALGRRADIDINRVKRIPNQVTIYPYNLDQTQDRNDRLIIRSNDYDDHSSWYQQPRAPLPSVRPTETALPKNPVQIHQPREDPRLYYQSDAYLKENGRKHLNEEVTFVYPGRDIVEYGGQGRHYSQMRSKEVDTLSSAYQGYNICVKCPHDRTLVAKAWLGRVVLENPILQACSGRKPPGSARFVHMYGPKIGSLLKQGSHMIIGRIMYRNKNLQLCKMQVHVVTQGCATPKYLEAHCWNQNKHCNFTCTNKQLEVSGPMTQVCGEDMRWKGELPVCKVRTWCELPPPPEHGRVSCQGAPAGAGLTEGSRCRVRCARGFRNMRVTPVCRRGAWTHALLCKPVHRTATITKQ